MPQPFAWIDIPPGQVNLGGYYGANGGYVTESMRFNVSAFSIAKYPLTNAQFAKFIEADGYNHQDWWTDDGWQMRENEGVLEPRFWKDVKWNKLNYPVVGISWYEAIAFCHWLSEVSGENITLPTDQEWQRAAQGDTQWAYPYGDNFDERRCNFNAYGTTSVTQYEGRRKGNSPFGVVDMSGNVWEWCLTKFEANDNKPDGTDVRILRGGSWNDNTTDKLRVDYRYGNTPSFAYNYFRGFRIARS